jgi:hypothetical protein
LIAVAAAALLVGGPLLAQFPGGFGGAGLLLNPGVQKELKLTDEQIEKAKTVSKEVFGKFKDDFVKLKDATPEERREKGQELMKKMAAESQKALDGVLKPEQSKRLKQIEMQMRGLADADAQKALNLSDEQKTKLKQINEDIAKERREIIKTAKDNPKEAQEKLAKLRDTTREKQMKLLSSEQQKQWKDLTGEPFELKFERPTPKQLAFPGGQTGIFCLPPSLTYRLAVSSRSK